MPIPVLNFPELQGSPLLSGMQAAQNVTQGGLRNQLMQKYGGQAQEASIEQKLAQAQALRAKGASSLAAANPFQAQDQSQLQKDLVNVNNAAANEKETNMPLYGDLKTALAKVPLGTGPLRGKILWSTPQGQYFSSLLVKAQGNFIKGFHLGRMTQKEFNFLQKASGSKEMYANSLSKIFDRQINSGKKVLKKQQFFNNYVQKGGRSSQQANNSWIKSLDAPPSEADPLHRPANIENMNAADLQKIASGG